MYTFTKEERLCSKKHLDLLFKNGSSFLLYPFRVSYFIVESITASSVQVVISVPKKRYKHAVDRNLIKRRIREAYRLNKGEKLNLDFPSNSNTLLLSIQFVGKEILEFAFVQTKLVQVLNKLKTIVHENN